MSIPAVTASLVAERDRLSFLPTFLGPSLFLRGEILVYNWMDYLSKDYNGGFWNFYTLSNGGFYLAPSTNKTFSLCVEGNGFEGELSADAAGIVATLFMLNELANRTEEERIIDSYYHLLDFVGYHSESGLIYGAID